MAKLIIKLVNAVGEVINNDPQVNGHLRVLFMPDFNVKNGQRLYPAADLSEQISMAGKEASGTGNMKFSMNGALTIGTLDGANVEIRDEVGHDNFFLFGMTAPEVQQRQADGYRPWELYHGDDELKSAVDLISSGLFSHGDTELFRPLTDNLIHSDPFMVLADFHAYVECQRAGGPPTAPRTTGTGCRSSTPRAWASSPRTAPSRTTWTRSGRRRRCPSSRRSARAVNVVFASHPCSMTWAQRCSCNAVSLVMNLRESTSAVRKPLHPQLSVGGHP
jgi:glucan phosphorylase